MAQSASVTDFDELQDYSANELHQFLPELEKFESNKLDEPDFDIGNDQGEEEGESGPEDNVPLTVLRTSW